MVRKFLRDIKSRWMPSGTEPTYSQCGEDRICKHLLGVIFRVEHPTYLDIGANDPVKFSNTYLFYCSGSTGVLVEPDPDLAKVIRQKRNRDLCLQVGISDGTAGTAPGSANLHVFDTPSLNTFSDEAAAGAKELGFKVVKTVPVPLMHVNQLLAEHFKTAPNLVSLDTEGFDEKILASWDFGRFRPNVICIETVSFASRKKTSGAAVTMESNGYIPYADTHLNTIFVDAALFEKMNK